MTRTTLYAAVAASVLLAPAAYATPFAVNTNGSNFSDVSFDGSACTPVVLSGPPYPAAPFCSAHRIEWHSGDLKTLSGGYSSNPGVNALGVQIGGLQMTTGATPSSTATLNYNLVIAITKPTGATESFSYGLSLTTHASSPGPGGTNTIQVILGSALSPMSVEAVDGTVYTLSDFTFVNDDISALPGTSYVDGVWSVESNAGGQIADLLLDADVSVPEPGTLAILGSGLGLLGMVRRRRARKS